jgi:hypothetical protein
MFVAIDRTKIIGIRAGARSAHRFIGICVVVVNGRVYARSWTRDPHGWHRAFLEDLIAGRLLDFLRYDERSDELLKAYNV